MFPETEGSECAKSLRQSRNTQANVAQVTVKTGVLGDEVHEDKGSDHTDLESHCNNSGFHSEREGMQGPLERPCDENKFMA